MNSYIFKHILEFILSEISIDNKNVLLNNIEEYIEWLVYSETRFKKDYSHYKDVMQKCQVHLLLNDYSALRLYIENELLSLKAEEATVNTQEIYKDLT